MISTTTAEAATGLKKREVMFVIGSLGVGGTERHLATICPELVRIGWKVLVFSIGGSGPQQEKLEIGGVEVITPPPNKMKMSRFANRVVKAAVVVHLLFKTLTGRRPAIVHFFLPAAYLIGAPLAMLARVKIRVMSRRSLNLYQRGYPLIRSFEILLHRRMSAILGNSLSVVRELIEQEEVPRSQVGLIYNGTCTIPLNGPKLKPEMRTVLNIELDAVVFVIVANLIPYKGHSDLFDAFALAAAELEHGWRLLVVGRDDGIEQGLRAKAVALGIDQNIRFLGSRDDVPAILTASDVGILCSHEEGFSNAILEGMAACLPMIVTDVGGNGEAVIDNETGIIVPPRNSPALAEAIVRLSGNAAMREKLGAAGRLRVGNRFSIASCVNSYDALYRNLLGGCSPCDIPEIQPGKI